MADTDILSFDSNLPVGGRGGFAHYNCEPPQGRCAPERRQLGGSSAEPGLTRAVQLLRESGLPEGSIYVWQDAATPQQTHSLRHGQ